MSKVLCGWLPRCKGPALQGVCEGLACWSGAVLCPACLRGHGPLALMVSADEVPFCLPGYDAPDLTAGCPRPRSDRFAIISHGPRNLFRADAALVGRARPQAAAEPSAGVR